MAAASAAPSYYYFDAAAARVHSTHGHTYAVEPWTNAVSAGSTAAAHGYMTMPSISGAAAAWHVPSHTVMHPEPRPAPHAPMPAQVLLAPGVSFVAPVIRSTPASSSSSLPAAAAVSVSSLSSSAAAVAAAAAPINEKTPSVAEDLSKERVVRLVV